MPDPIDRFYAQRTVEARYVAMLERHHAEWFRFFEARGMDPREDPECAEIMRLASAQKVEGVTLACEVLT